MISGATNTPMNSMAILTKQWTPNPTLFSSWGRSPPLFSPITLRAYGKAQSKQRGLDEERPHVGSLLLNDACYFRTDTVHMKGTTGVDGSFVMRQSLDSTVVVPTV